MPQSFEEAFPQLRAVQPFMPLGPALAWQGALDWADEAAIVLFARTVLERMTFAAERELGWLNEIADAATRDLNALLATAPDERATRSILFLRFLFTLPAMEAAFSHGRRGASYDWAFRGLTADYDDRRRRNDGYVYLPLRQLGDPRIGAYATRWLPRWCHSFFLMARDAEVRREVAATFTPCWEELDGILRVDGPGDEPLRTEIFFAYASMASWAVHEDDDHAEAWVWQLVDAWNKGDIPGGAASVVATVFITKAHPLTGRSVRDWAQEVLDRLGGTLREHERLQFLVATIDTWERWRQLRPELLREIAELNARAADAEEIGGSALFAREARLDIVKPLVALLVRQQDLAGVVDILSAWYRAGGTAPCADDVLLVHPAFGDGVATLWPGGTLIDTATTPGGHERVVAALDEALGNCTDPDAPPFDERREGMPNYALGHVVETAMTDYYRPATLKRNFRRMGDPRSLLVFPSVSDPLQALLARDLGLTLPLEVSLAAAEDARPVRLVSIWAGSTYYTDFEVRAIEAFAKVHGWRAEIYPASAEGDADDFLGFYRQFEPDVLWVAGHGEFVAHRPDETGIVVGSPRATRVDDVAIDTILPMATVAALDVPGPGRRLLVLNTCNGATTQGMAGMARIGLAQSLVGPRQTVIGHLWPASSALALAFGALLASHLDGRDATAAFAATLADLRDPAGIVQAIESRLGAQFDGGFRISSDLRDLASIMAWGCPVLLT